MQGKKNLRDFIMVIMVIFLLMIFSNFFANNVNAVLYFDKTVDDSDGKYDLFYNR